MLRAERAQLLVDRLNLPVVVIHQRETGIDGRTAKTIHLPDYCDDLPFRRRSLTQLNRGESRHALARDICHGHRGELRQRYRHGQEEQLGALGLIVNAIASTTRSHPTRPRPPRRDGPTDRRRRHRAAQPLGSGHLTLTGRYRIALAEALHDRGAYRELNAGTAGGLTRLSARTGTPPVRWTRGD